MRSVLKNQLNQQQLYRVKKEFTNFTNNKCRFWRHDFVFIDFHLDGCVDRQNCCDWSPKYLRSIYEKQMHPSCACYWPMCSWWYYPQFWWNELFATIFRFNTLDLFCGTIWSHRSVPRSWTLLKIATENYVCVCKAFLQMCCTYTVYLLIFLRWLKVIIAVTILECSHNLFKNSFLVGRDIIFINVFFNRMWYYFSTCSAFFISLSLFTNKTFCAPAI